MDPRLKLYLIAGEPSGDALGAALMSGLKDLCADVEFLGIGGPLMQAEGLNSLFPMDDLSVMGLAEVLPRLRHLFRRRDQTVRDILAAAPDVLITIDSPDFCLRVARKIKAHSDMLTVHYVAPSVWAWRPGRAEKMRGIIDHVLALLPFEPSYMQAAGMSCDFVGHPVVAAPLANMRDAAHFRLEYGLGDGPLILALPGSRRGEIARLGDVFGRSLAQVLQQHPEARVVVPAAAPVAQMVTEMTQNWPGKPVVLDPNTEPELAAPRKRAAFRAADVALAASGTVSLELAAHATPMVIAYDMNWLSRLMISRLLRVDTVTLVNLVSQTRAVPEFLGSRCRSELIAPAIMAALDRPQDQIAACNVTMDRLGRNGKAPGLRAAASVLGALRR